MENLTDLQKKQLDYLLADFVAIKGEIARRSTLQWFILAAYFSVLALVFQQTAASKLSGLWVTAAWVVSALAYQFHSREYLEIMRLSGFLIGGHIAPVASEILGVAREVMLPSESRIPDFGERRRRWYAVTFNWAAFFCVPLLLTTFLLWRLQCGSIGDTWRNLLAVASHDVRAFVLPFAQAAITVFCAGRVTVLLRRHPV